MIFKFYISLFISLLCIAVCRAQPAKKAITQSIKIEFRNVVDSQAMRLGTSYKNPFGEEYTPKNFKYYISNISLHTVDGKIVSSRGSHLINEADSTSKTIALKVPAGKFKQISFTVGVDSIYNVSGTQTGDLDPLKGMFWTWNSGYIMAKLEATSAASTAANNNVAYHIGGFKGVQKTPRKVVLQFTDTLRVDGNNKVVIEANANKWFDGEHSMKISTTPLCSSPGKLAAQFADNYSKMFKIAATN
jgi:hypothetical protein